MKKKLCFVISSMMRGGAERVMSILVNESVRRGYEVHLLLQSSPQVEYELNCEVNVVDLSCKTQGVRGLVSAIKRIAALKEAILSIKPDLVISFLTVCNMYTSLALRGTGIPVIVSERNDPVKDCPNVFKRWLRNYCYGFATGYIFQTGDAKNHFNNTIQSKSIIIPNPVKNGLPNADVSSAAKTIVAAARLNKQKNYPLLLNAFKLFLSDYPDYTLKIFGDGDKKDELVVLCQKLGIFEKVTFEGNVNNLHDRIKDARMFVLSSDYEGISNSLLEAMAMGLPCISTDCPCGGSRMLIEDGVSGLLTPVGNVEAFHKAMKKIADSDELALKLSENAKAVRRNYSEDVILKQYFEFMGKYI